MNEKVSIIIPVYNGEKYIKEAIDSALNQTYKNIEVIVINDGSIDNTDEICKSYKDKIRYFKKENGGVATALNYGISKMTGKYVSWLSHDDIYYPTKVEDEMTCLKNQKNNNVIVACNVELVDQDLNLIEQHHLSEKLEKYPLSYLAFNVTTGLNGCALLIPKTLFEKHGLFNQELKATQDYDLWARFSESEKFVILDKVLVKSRQHKEQGSRTIKTVQHEVDELYSRFISKISDQEFKEYFNNDLTDMLNTVLLFKDSMHSYNASISMFEKILKVFKKDEKKLIDFYNTNFLYEENSNFKFNNSNKKRIILYNNVWVRGGIERVLTTIFKNLKTDYELFFVSSKIDYKNGFKIPKEVNVIKVGEEIKSKLPVAILSLCKLLKIDLFIGNQNLDINVLNTYKILNENNIKSIASNHYSYYLPAEIPYLEEVLEKRDQCYKNATAVVWTNSVSAKLHAIKQNNSYYIPNPNSFKVSNKVTKNNKNIICVGRFDDALKHIELTLEAFKKALDKDKKLKLIIVGKIDLEMKLSNNQAPTLGVLLNQLNIPKTNIKFVGETSNVEKYYKNASLLILTSQSEGFGMVITEAATFGIPTIAFNILGLRDIINNEVNGYLINAYNVDEMANKIVEYFSNENKMTIMKNNILKKSKEYEENVIITEWKKLIQSLLEDNFKSNIKDMLLPSDVMKIFDKTLKNINKDIIYTKEEHTDNEGLIKKFFSKVKYQYKMYGLKKTIKEICIYPFKVPKKILNRINKKGR